MNLSSSYVIIEKSGENIVSILSDATNYARLMPETAKNFTVISSKSFSFSFSSIPSVALQIKQLIPANRVILENTNDRIPFTLQINIQEVSDCSSKINIDFVGDFNAMMAMMIKKPLTQFLEDFAKNLAKI